MGITLVERYGAHGSNSTSLLDNYANPSVYPVMMTSLEAILVVLGLLWIVFCLSTFLGDRTANQEKRAQESQESLYLQLRESVHQALQGGSDHIRYAETPSGLGDLGD